MLLERSVFVPVGRLLGKHHHHHHRNADGQRSQSVHRCPAKGLRQWRRNQHRHGSAHIARADQAHRQAFVARWKRARAQRQCHAKAGSGNAQQHTHGQQVIEGLNKEKPEQHGYCYQRHFNQRCVFAANVLRQQTQWKSHQRTGNDGN